MFFGGLYVSLLSIILTLYNALAACIKSETFSPAVGGASHVSIEEPMFPTVEKRNSLLSLSKLTSKEVDCIWDITEYNNAGSKYKLVKLVEADGRNDIDNEKYSTNSDLFSAGKVISNLKWNDGKSLGITITVKSISSEKATIVIE